MRTTMNRLLRPLSCCLVALACLSSLRAEDKIPAEQVLPPDTMFMISVPDISEMKSRFDETVWSDLFTNPEMAGLWDALMKPAQESLAEMKKETGIDWRDLQEIPSGELTLSVSRISRGKIGMVVSIEYGEDSEALNKLLTKVEENLEDAEREKTVTEIEGTEVVSYVMTPEEAPNPQELCWLQKDGYFLLSNQVRALEAVLLRWDGKNSEVLAEQTEFKYIRERCSGAGSQPVMYWYVNPLLALRSGLEMGQSATSQAMVQAFLPRLGLDKLKAIGGAIDLATERYEEVSQTVIYAEGPQVGLLKMFQASEVPISPPNWVSAEAESFLIYHWGLEAAVAEVRTLVDSFQGQGAFDVILDQVADHPGAQGLHPKKDFIDLLTGTLVVEMTPPPSAEGAPVNLFAMELKDAQKMNDVLAKVQQSSGGEAETRNFQGSIIYTLPLGAEQSLNLVVSQNHLFVSDSNERIEQIIRGGDSYKRMKDSKTYQQLAAEAPESAGMWGMEQTGRQLERASKQITELLETLPAPDGETDNIASEVLKNFPSTEVLKKYATDTFFYVTTDERGVYWKSYSLRVKK